MQIGWIGTGVMGNSMCMHLLQAGHEITVFNRTKEKANDLILSGAIWKNNPKEVAESSEIIFTILGYPKDVESVYFGENGIFSGAHKGQILVDMTTTKPSLAEQINKKAIELGLDSLDAPVSGGDIGAKNGTLSIMVGGNLETYNKVLPFFKILGSSIILEGKAGSGQHTKMANQIVIAGTMMGVSEALVYAKKTGLNLNKMVETISGGAAGCWTLNNLAPRVIKGDFAPGFFIDHFIKDMTIAQEEANNRSFKLDSLSLAIEKYKQLQTKGLGKEGTQALVKALDMEEK